MNQIIGWIYLTHGLFGLFLGFSNQCSFHCFPWLSMSQLHLAEGPGSCSCLLSLVFTCCYLKLSFPSFSSSLVSLKFKPVHTWSALKPVMLGFPKFSQSSVNKVALNIHKWEDRKSPKDRKDSHWLWGSPWGDLKKEANSNGCSASTDIFVSCSPGKKKPSLPRARE